MAAGTAVTTSIVPEQVVDQLAHHGEDEEPNTRDQTVQQAPEVDDVSVATVQVNVECDGVIAKLVINIATELSPVSPSKLINQQRTIGQQCEVTWPGFVRILLSAESVAQ